MTSRAALRSFVSAAVVSHLSLSIAFAQAPAAPPSPEPEAAAPAAEGLPPEQTEEIVVTGTRIRRKDLTTPAPVTVITRDQVIASGKVSVGDYIQSLPEQGNAVNTTVNNGGDGSTRVNLRGLGTGRTLVLVNGRRMVGVGSPQFLDTSVDLNMIPSSAVERIEILKDGASAVYGSDAIGGVVNIITRKDLDGVEASAYGGVSSYNDAQYVSVSATGGTRSDRGELLFNLGYDKNYASFAGDRSYSQTQLLYDYGSGDVFPNGSSAIPAGRFTVPVVRDAEGTITGCEAGGTALYQSLCSQSVASQNPVWLPDGGAPDGYRQYGGVPDTFNFQPFNYNLTPQQRISIFSTGGLRLGAGTRAFYEAQYVNRQSDQQFAPEPLFTVLVTPPVTMSKDSIYNPLGVDLADVRRRLVEFGNRRQTQDLDTFRVVAGFDGSLPAVPNWAWDASLNYGRTQGIQLFEGGLRTPRIQDAVGPSMIDPATNEPICVRTPGDASTAIPGCVPLNLFHVATPNNPSGAIDASQIAGLGYAGTTRTRIQMTSVQLNASGDLVPLLADRPMGLAVGYEYRREFGQNVPDAIAAAGESSDLNFSETSGGYYVNEGYAELSVPIVSGRPFASNLEATAATRVSKYSTFGTHATYKLGGRWSVLPDVTLRGTWSTAFRAPSVSELFLGQADNFPTAADPCAGTDPVTGEARPVDPTSTIGQNCGAAINNGDTAIQLKTRNGGNPDLDPETAKVFTVGVVLEPRAVRNLTVTVDYFHFDIEDSIATRGAGVILNGCLTGSNPEFCGFIHRDPVTQIITSIDDLNTNVGSDTVDGIDLAARYAVPTPFGRFALVFDGTWLHKYDRVLADGTLVTGKGTFDLAINQGGIGGVYPSWKWNAGATWGKGPFGAGITTRYIGGFKECADITGASSSAGACYLNAGLSHDVSAYNAWDAYVSYDLRGRLGRTSIAIGGRNIFDTAPPVVYNSFTPTSDPTAYDFLGAFWYVRLTQAI